MDKIVRTTIDYLMRVRLVFWHNYCRCCDTSIAEDDEYFCSGCWSKIGFCLVDNCCKRCGREIGEFGQLFAHCAACEDENFNFDSITCAGIYKSPLSDLILKFKLSDKTSLLPILTEFTQKAISRTDYFNSVDYIVPVPVHWRRRFQRGFNQTELIAKGLKLPNASFSNDLVRIRHTQSQTAVTFAARRRNVKDAFAVRKGHQFKEKNICIIDDVKTTGATLDECAKVLKEAGANKVFAFALAAAGQKDKT